MSLLVIHELRKAISVLILYFESLLYFTLTASIPQLMPTFWDLEKDCT